MPVTAAIIGGVSGLAQLGMGISDRVKGNKRLKQAQSFWEQNKYEIPSAARASLGVAERQSQTFRLPGEDIRRAEIGQTTSQGLNAAESAATNASDVLNVLSSLYGSQQQQEQDLALAGAQRYDQNQAMLMSELGRMANLEREKWQYNSLFPYQQMLGQAEAYQQRGAQGIGMGLGTLGQVGGDIMQLNSAQNQYQDFLNRNVYSLGGNQTQQPNWANMNPADRQYAQELYYNR